MPASGSSSELSSQQMAIRSHPGVQKMPASGISSELSAHQMAPAGAIAHSRPHLFPRASSLSFSSLVSPLRPLGSGLLGRGDPRYFSMALRTQVRPAIEFVSGKEGLRPLFWLDDDLLYDAIGTRTLQVRLLGHPEDRKRPWSLRGSRRDGNGGRFVRSPCLPSWRGSRLLYAVHQTLSLCSLYSNSPLSSRPQPLGRVGDDTPCEDTREDSGLFV